MKTLHSIKPEKSRPTTFDGIVYSDDSSDIFTRFNLTSARFNLATERLQNIYTTSGWTTGTWNATWEYTLPLNTGIVLDGTV